MLCRICSSELICYKINSYLRRCNAVFGLIVFQMSSKAHLSVVMGAYLKNPSHVCNVVSTKACASRHFPF